MDQGNLDVCSWDIDVGVFIGKNHKRILDDIRKESNKMKIFISHSSKDQKISEKLKELLENSGTNVTVFSSSDKGAIPIAHDFVKYIFEELKSSEYFIPLLSEDYFSSKFCMIEWGMAGAFHFSKKKGSTFKSILPVYVYPLKPDEAIERTPFAHLQCYDLANKFAAQSIIETINPDSKIDEADINEFARFAKQESTLKKGVFDRAKDIFTCSYGEKVYVEDWDDFVKCTVNRDANEATVSYNLNPYEKEEFVKPDFVSLVFKYYDALDLYSFINYSQDAKLVFKVLNFTNSIKKLQVEIKYSGNQFVGNPCIFEVVKGLNEFKLPLEIFENDKLRTVDQICFVVKSSDFVEDEGTFVLKDFNVVLE